MMVKRGKDYSGGLTAEEMRARSREVAVQQVVFFLNGSNKVLRATAESREEARVLAARRFLPYFNHAEQRAILAATNIELEKMPCTHCRAAGGGCSECGGVQQESGECLKS